MPPPKIKVRGAARAKGIPQGYVLGRVSNGTGDVELLRMPDLARLGVQGRNTPALLALIPELTILANPGPGEGRPEPLSMSDILDFISTNQGDILYRGPTEWLTLIPGDPGQVLTTGGSGADPSWEDASSGGGTDVVWDDGTVPTGNTVANTTSATFGDSEYTFPANIFVLYDVIKVTLRGVFTTDTTPSLNIELILGSTVIAETGSVALASSITDQSWEVNFLAFVQQQLGASGELEAQGSAQLDGYKGMPNLAPIVIDTTADQRLRVRFTWSAASATNSISMRQLLVQHKPGIFEPPVVTEMEFIATGGDGETFYMDVTGATRSYIVPTSYITEE